MTPMHLEASQAAAAVARQLAANAGVMTDLATPLRALVGTANFSIPPHMHPTIAPIAMIQSFYRLVNVLAVRRGFDPDHPLMLNKVTHTR